MFSFPLDVQPKVACRVLICNQKLQISALTSYYELQVESAGEQITNRARPSSDTPTMGAQRSGQKGH
jgi:hypothetical protein